MVELFLLLCTEMCFGFPDYLVLHKIHCDVATNVRRLPRLVIVPCTLIVAGILVQIIAVVPSEPL